MGFLSAPLTGLAVTNAGNAYDLTLVGGAGALASIDADTSYLQLPVRDAAGTAASWAEGVLDTSAVPAGAGLIYAMVRLTAKRLSGAGVTPVYVTLYRAGEDPVADGVTATEPINSAGYLEQDVDVLAGAPWLPDAVAAGDLVLRLTNGDSGLVNVARVTTAELQLAWNDPPANNQFAAAVALAGTLEGDLLESVSLSGATVEAEEPGGLLESVWFTWTCPADVPDEVTLSVVKTASETTGAGVLAINVYTGAALGALVLVGSGSVASGYDETAQADATFTPVAGTVYRIQVGVDAADASINQAGMAWSSFVDVDASEEAAFEELEDETDVPDDAFVPDPEIAAVAPLVRVSETYPDPIFGYNGRPVDWAVTSVVREDWGRLSIAVDGVAVTVVRGIRSRLQEASFQEPFGEGPARLLVRGASVWDKGKAGFEWLREEANVNIDRVDVDGDFVRSWWCGIVQTIEPTADGWLLGLEGAFAGPSSMMPHRPRLTEASRDWVKAMIMALRRAGRGAARRKTITEVTCGIETRDRGSRDESVLAYVQRGLAQCQTADGDQWTVARVLDGSGHPIRRKYGFRLKDRTTVDFTIRAGQRGVDVSGLRRDAADVTRMVFAEGVDEDGGRWRNTKLPNVGKETTPPYPGSPLSLGDSGDDVAIWQAEVHSDGWGRTGDLEVIINGEFGTAEAEIAELIQEAAGLAVTGVVNEATWDATWSNGLNAWNLGGARFDPIAQVTAVEPWLYSSNGSRIAANPSHDRTVLPIGRFVGMGQDVTKKQGRRWGRAEVARNADPGWRGMIVIDDVDPPQLSRMDILEGMNVRLLDFDDEPLFHIAGVTFSESGPGYRVSLAVDERARDLLTLAEIHERNKQARLDPARQALAQLRRSKQARDTPAVWDREFYGDLPRREHEGGGWRVFKVAAGKYGSLSRVKLTCTPDVEFAVALFGTKPERSWLQGNVGDPLGNHGEDVDYRYWDRPGIQDGLRARLYIESWGDFDNPCGYSPGYKTNPESGKATGHALTGRFDTETSTDYAIDAEPIFYVAVFSEAPTQVRGQLFLLPNE